MIDKLYYDAGDLPSEFDLGTGGTAYNLKDGLLYIRDRYGHIDTLQLSKVQAPIDLPLKHGWVAFSATLPRAVKSGNQVHVDAVIKNGMDAQDTIIAVLPEGYRPSRTIFVPLMNWSTVIGTVAIHSDGNVRGTGLNKTVSMFNAVFTLL